MISTQVIDISMGGPAVNLPVVLDMFVTGHGWREIGEGVTDPDGIVESFSENGAAPAIYRLTFDVAAFRTDPFFPSISITFEIGATEDDCHIALHLGAYGYSVARN
jgi:5-hydroxyisourate hydrolase-like protein (transthyretin family)